MTASSGGPLAGRFFEMPAELVAHRRENLALKIGQAARAEALVQRAAQDGHGNAFVDGGLDGPPAFAGIRDTAFECGELGILHQGRVSDSGEGRWTIKAAIDE